MAKIEVASQPFVVVDANAIASWLEQAPDTLWTVDGDDDIAELINLPALAIELARVLRAHGDKLRVFAPAPAIESWKSSSDVSALAQPDDDGKRAFFVAWDSDEDPRWPVWALARDVRAEEALAALA